MKMRILGSLLIAAGLLMLGAGAYFADLFKDGMGPDAVTSVGAAAQERFWSAFKHYAGWAMIPFIAGVVIVSASFRKQAGAAQQGVPGDVAASRRRA